MDAAIDVRMRVVDAVSVGVRPRRVAIEHAFRVLVNVRDQLDAGMLVDVLRHDRLIPRR